MLKKDTERTTEKKAQSKPVTVLNDAELDPSAGGGGLISMDASNASARARGAGFYESADALLAVVGTD